MTPLDIAGKRIAALEQLNAALMDEVEFYKRQLGIEVSEQRVRMIMGATGLSYQQAMILHVLRFRFPKPVHWSAIDALVPVLRYKRPAVAGEDKRIHVHICHLRNLIGKQMIRTFSGVGYALSDEGKAWLDDRLSLKVVA